MWDTIGSLWCQLTHGQPMWPIHGHYQCRVCGRRYPVAWEAPPAAAGRPATYRIRHVLRTFTY